MVAGIAGVAGIEAAAGVVKDFFQAGSGEDAAIEADGVVETLGVETAVAQVGFEIVDGWIGGVQLGEGRLDEHCAHGGSIASFAVGGAWAARCDGLMGSGREMKNCHEGSRTKMNIIVQYQI
jgi:hypothetical protein